MKNKRLRSTLVVLLALFCLCLLGACDGQEKGRGAGPVENGAPSPPPDGGEENGDGAKGRINYGNVSDEELVEYLLSEVPAAYEMVRVMAVPMKALVTGETTELDGACRDIWLGTELDEKFTREILYTVSPSGKIYEYDPLGDNWEIRN